MTKRLLIFAAAIVAVVLTVAACGAKSSASTVSGTPSTTVAVKRISGVGTVLVNASGMPIYANLQDDRTSTCNGACAMIWKPVTVKGTPTETGMSGKLGTVTRGDGSRQVTVNGKPVYTFVEDHPGQVTGNGFHDQFGSQKFEWHVVLSSGQLASGSASSTATPSGGSGSGSSGGLYGGSRGY